MAKHRKITPKQLDKIMDEAARTWNPVGAGRVKDVVNTLLSTNDPAGAVSLILLHAMIGRGLGKRAVYELMLASSGDYDTGWLVELPGDAWERLYCNPDVIDAIATAAYGPEGRVTKESKPTESDHAND